MTTHFRTVKDGIEVSLTPEERMFLSDVLPMLAGVGAEEGDPAAERFRVPVYLDDPESNDEWWRLMGEDLEAGRRADRAIFERTVTATDRPVLDDEEANALLRVLNEARLALGARFGIDVEEDHETIPPDSRQVLDYLGWIQEELTIELLRRL